MDFRVLAYNRANSTVFILEYNPAVAKPNYTHYCFYMRMTQAKIHLSHLIHNLKTIKNHLQHNNRPLISAAVKSNAYGHDIRIITKSLLRAGIDSFVVANIHEAILLREFGVNLPIYLLSIPHPDEFPELIINGITPMIDDVTLAHMLDKAAAAAHKVIKVHMKIDTGMGRIGCLPERAVDLRASIDACANLEYTGTATHMSSADVDPAFTEEQLHRFKQCCDGIDQTGYSLGMIHVANSATSLRFSHLLDEISTMVRIGIALYGYNPSTDTSLDLLPVMELSSYVVAIKRVPKNHPISYGVEYRTKQETSIAVIPAGYGDGIPRSLGNKGTVYINGHCFPIVGRLCMDHCMVDIGDAPIQRYAPVTLFGPQKGAPTAIDVAKLCNTIPYEITCGISTTVPRVAV